MNVIVDARGGSVAWDGQAIVALATFALERLGLPERCELSVSLVSRDEIAQLNGAYRGIDAPTDVLSFPCESPADVPADAPLIELGDVVICTDVVEEQRVRFGLSFEEEASLMLVHSILHLLGHDHEDERGAAAMEAREKDILDAYGLTGIR